MTAIVRLLQRAKPTDGVQHASLSATSTPDRYILSASVPFRPDTERHLEIDGSPEFRQAQAWERSVRRIDHVEFCRCDETWHTTIAIVGNRLPLRRPVAMATALALALDGHPLVVCAPTITHEGIQDGRLPL